MKKLLIATKNPGKFREIKEVLGELENSSMNNGGLELLFLKDVLNDEDFLERQGILDFDDRDFLEDGETFEANSIKKAQYYGDKFGLPTLGEDSGIIVDALAGELGVKTRRWGAGENASDQEWIDYFLERMIEVPDSERGAKFVCFSAFYEPGSLNNLTVKETLDSEKFESGSKNPERFKIFNGETRGKITKGLEAEIIPGIPLSSCFVPEGFEEVYTKLSVAEKNRISHRGKAMKDLRDFLAKW